MVGLLTGSVGSIPTLVCFTIGRVGRAAEGTGLLNRHTGNCVVSSNLTLSAKIVRHRIRKDCKRYSWNLPVNPSDVVGYGHQVGQPPTYNL
jgi:hypothetical protein